MSQSDPTPNTEAAPANALAIIRERAEHGNHPAYADCLFLLAELERLERHWEIDRDLLKDESKQAERYREALERIAKGPRFERTRWDRPPSPTGAER